MRLCRLISLLSLGLACTSSRAPPVDAAKAAELAQALEITSPEWRPILATRGLAELEVGRLGPQHLAALEALASEDPGRDAVIREFLRSAEADALWRDGCEGTLDAALAEVATHSQAVQATRVDRICNPAASVAHPVWRSGGVDPMAAFLWWTTTRALAAHGALHEGEEAALMHMGWVPIVHPR